MNRERRIEIGLVHLGCLSNYLHRGQRECLSYCIRRSEDRQFFINRVGEMVERINQMPVTYEQDGKGDEAMVFLHYFTGSSDWWIMERDIDQKPLESQPQAFGLAQLNGGSPELGYIPLDGLLASLGVVVELDLHFTPKTLGEVRRELELVTA